MASGIAEPQRSSYRNDRLAISEPGYRTCQRRNIAASPDNPVANSSRLDGSRTTVDESTVVCVDGSVTVVVPSRFTSTVAAKPSTVSVVRAGIVPAGSENILKAKTLPDVDLSLIHI